MNRSGATLRFCPKPPRERRCARHSKGIGLGALDSNETRCGALRHPRDQGTLERYRTPTESQQSRR